VDVAITYSKLEVSLIATVSTPSAEILVPLATGPEPSLVELTVHAIPRTDALNRKVPPAITDDKLFSVPMVILRGALDNVKHPVITSTISVKRENILKYSFIFLIFFISTIYHCISNNSKTGQRFITTNPAAPML